MKADMPNLPRTSRAFRFYSRLDLKELTGRKARDVRELLAHLRESPEEVVYYHTHRFLQQHQFLVPEPPNDFAYWTREVLGLSSLGERMASVNIAECATIEEIRRALIRVLEEAAKQPGRLRKAERGREFHFIKSVSVIFPTPYAAVDLREFAEGLRRITIDALYFHMFEARLRLKQGGNDFSYWLESALGEKDLADRISRLDPYTHTMERLRRTIVRLVEARIRQILGRARRGA